MLNRDCGNYLGRPTTRTNRVLGQAQVADDFITFRIIDKLFKVDYVPISSHRFCRFQAVFSPPP